MNCSHCGNGPMIHLGFGYYQCRLVELKYRPKIIDSGLFNPKCLNTQKLS